VEDHKIMAAALINLWHKRVDFEVLDVAETAEGHWSVYRTAVEHVVMDVVLPQAIGERY
jgi:DNA-binding NarL/FixJ family response regulator